MGAAWASGGTSVGVCGFSLGAVAIVSVYGTHTVASVESRGTTPGGATGARPEGPEAGADTEGATDEVDVAVLAVQRNPKYPELGATRAEARVMCEHERGAWVDQGTKVGCQIRRANVFACELAEDATARACTHWKLGAEVGDEHGAITATAGKPKAVETDARGFRAYT